MKELFATIAFVFVLLPAGLALVQRRIFNGREAIENEFPFMVSIRAAGMQCGGVIVSECFVLTAGHCLMNLFKGQVFTVVLGAHSYYKYSNETKEIIIRGNMTFSIHENFSMPSAEDDLGIIKLPSCVKFSDNINAVKVSTDLDIDQRKEVVTVIAGWGSTQIHYSADNLQTGEMKLLPISDCFQHQKHYVEKITKKHICATGLNSKPGHVVGPCNGDSGSPLVLAGTRQLIGITSFVKDAKDGKPLSTNDCESDIAPAVYVRVASYLDWISEKTGIQFD